jgi:hypothetical protein
MGVGDNQAVAGDRNERNGFSRYQTPYIVLLPLASMISFSAIITRTFSILTMTIAA